MFDSLPACMNILNFVTTSFGSEFCVVLVILLTTFLTNDFNVFYSEMRFNSNCKSL